MNLPPIPEGLVVRRTAHGISHFFTVLQMDSYGRACVQTALEQAAKATSEPLTQERAEELAHRRCRRYIMIDDAPYQFDATTLMDFVRDVAGAKP